MSTPASTVFQKLQQQLATRVLGQQDIIERLLIAVLADGHVLLEGPPGLAKTRAAYLLANSFSSSFQRIQFTPDLLPSDLLGVQTYNPRDHRFEFHPGPLFHNFILADEINRAPAKVQAALLEAMEERQITVGGETHRLDEPFFVIATQNPIEEEGTYELPAAQMDRFMMRIVVDYPDLATELAILDMVQTEKQQGSGYQAALLGLDPITVSDLQAARAAVLNVHIAEPIRSYIARLICATRITTPSAPAWRQHIAHPVSPRGTLAFARLAQARAWLNDRDHVLPDDIQMLAVNALSHRIGLSYRAEAEGVDVNQIIDQLLDHVAIL